MKRSFQINFKKEEIDSIINRIREFDWNKLLMFNDWEMGTNPVDLKRLCDYWVNEYDWIKNQIYLNSYSQFKSEIEDIELHYIHEKSKSKKNYPLVLIHGWPGSVSEFYKIIPNLICNSEDISFDIVAPSLPGFGFSSNPKTYRT